ncbi:MAG: serine/threonine protein kinase, partial [Kiritimatiellae bacterium]|nr:serine/threonine protein kinase [Kiritimatiellia bacterium]
MQGTPALPPGTCFGGDFTILRPIGAGGMASVYEAREEPLGRVVALKVLDPGAGAALRARFLAEAR